MAALNFPTATVVGQTYSANGNIWVWNGTAWRASSTSTTVLNDISPQFDGYKQVFYLMQDQTFINTLTDSKDLEVVINGQRLAPYVKELRFPWITPYDSFKGFRVVGTQLIIYDAPDIGDSGYVAIRGTSDVAQTKKYPYSATTIAFGD